MGYASACLVPPEEWVRFLAGRLSPRRLTEPPRTCGVRCPPLLRRRNGRDARRRCVRLEAQAGRGGFVSRRDHNQAAGNCAHLQGRASVEKESTQAPATLRERGSGGEALLLEKRPLPDSPTSPYLWRFYAVLVDCGGGRGGGSGSKALARGLADRGLVTLIPGRAGPALRGKRRVWPSACSAGRSWLLGLVLPGRCSRAGVAGSSGAIELGKLAAGGGDAHARRRGGQPGRPICHRLRRGSVRGAAVPLRHIQRRGRGR